MRFRVLVFLGAVFLALAGGTAFAGEAANHYVSGVEGIKAATLPPPGLYYRLYFVSYDADKLFDERGDRLHIDFDVNVLALVNRVVWISEYEVLGANYGADIVIPTVNTDIKIGALGLDQDNFGLGDICVDPLILAWHGARYDAAFGLGAFMPTGEYDSDDSASPGKDMWTGVAILGGTFYFDEKKTWSASILSWYEKHSQKNTLDITPGDDFHLEWGVGKTIPSDWIWEVGVAGYCQWQVTDDDGSDAVWDKGVHDQVYAIGPEVSVLFPKFGGMLSLRTLTEFAAKDRSEGQLTDLTFTKFF